jgi:hypothetical protein
MKKLLFIAVLFTAGFYGYPNISGFLGFGGAKFGIGEKDPLGLPAKYHKFLTSQGMSGDFGEENHARTMSYNHPDGAIIIQVGEEEYVQKVTGVFFGTQHGYSPQRPGAVEVIMSDWWKAAGGPKKLQYNTVTDGSWSIPRSVKFGEGFKIPIKHEEATFDSKDVKGRWAYDKSAPYDLVEIWLK